MALQFEGAIDNISEVQLNFIRDVVQKRGYKDNKVIVEPVGQAGDNYIANVKRIIVQDDDEEFRMIAKIAPQLQFIRKAAHTGKLFRNEHIMYTMVLPKFQQLEEQAGIPQEDRLRFTECYESKSEAPHEVILLEDLQVSGFVMLDRFKSLSDECIKEDLYDAWSHMAENEDTLNYFNQLENTAVMVVEGAERKRLLKGCIRQSIEQGCKIVKQDVGSKYSVIQQGDSWTNNIMFKFDGDVLQQSIMIDYQLSKECSPVYDIMYLLFNCTDYNTIVHHFNDWLDYYHSELDKALYNFGLKSNYIYPRDKLDADMKRYGRVMFGGSVIMASVMIMTPEIAAKVKEAMETAKNLDDLYEMEDMDLDYLLTFKQRVEGVIDSFVEFGLI